MRVQVTPLPSVDRGSLKAVLSDQQSRVRDAGNIRELPDRLFAYLDWATEASGQLRSYLRAESVDRLVFTRRYQQLLASGASLVGEETLRKRVLNGLINAEVAERIAEFDSAIRAVELRISRWSQLAMFLLADTNFYMQSEQLFDEIDFGGLVKPADLKLGGGTIHLIIPLAVIDELDSQKRRSEPEKRTRARQTLAIIDRLLADPDDQPFLTPRVGPAISVPVTLELLFDAPGHVRLPRTDDEIIDIILANQPFAARDITLVTFDTGMAMRARKARLKAIKLVEPEKPAKPSKDRGSRYPVPTVPTAS